MELLYQTDFYARWADMDFNGHMKNTAYLDYAADSRMLFFKENGFPMVKFFELQIGPVVFKDSIEYYKEMFMYQEFTVRLNLKKMSDDGSKFTLVNEFVRPDQKMSAVLTTEACWFSLSKRKPTAPPRELVDIFLNREKIDE